MKFIEITDIRDKTINVNVANIVTICDSIDFITIEMSNGKIVCSKIPCAVLMKMINPAE